MYLDHVRSFQLHGCSKKQTTVFHSSAESEIISPDAGLRIDGLPALQFGECVLEAL